MNLNSALLLVDLQNDYLDRSDLVPQRLSLVFRTEKFIRVIRQGGIPVLHSHTVYKPDGSDRMPHHFHNDKWVCIEGTNGSLAPAELAPAESEPVFKKTKYSAFSNPAVKEYLERKKIRLLMIAGVHTHACILQTALDAHMEGYTVNVVADAVATYDPLRGHLGREYLEQRGIQFSPSIELLKELALRPSGPDKNLPCGIVNGSPLVAAELTIISVHDPCDWNRVTRQVPVAGMQQIEQATSAAQEMAKQWVQTRFVKRCQVAEAVADQLKRESEKWVQRLIDDIGKPRQDAQAEITFAIQLIKAALTYISNTSDHAGTVAVRSRPLGVVAIITPWNNPISIPLGKLIPALLLGNTVVWKPAPVATRIASAIVNLLIECGIPVGVLNMVSGDGTTGHELVCDDRVDAVSFTGATHTGRQIAMLCAQRLLPLQAELGGNNPIVVMDDVDAAQIAEELARSAYGFSGQRCTATRRVLAQSTIATTLRQKLMEAAVSMRIGDPNDIETEIGPLLSREQQNSVHSHVIKMQETGAEVLCGGDAPAGFEKGCWYRPTLLGIENNVNAPEVFGPVITFEQFSSIEDAIARCNASEYGLTASIYTNNLDYWEMFRDRVLSGTIKHNQGTAGVDPAHPFGGWKQSGIGPPEHGIGDERFYSRVQTIYG